MKHMGTKLILKDLNFQIYANERVGIIGANGCGKSTILKMIAGIEPLNLYPGSWSPGYDYGWIAKPRKATVAYLDQIPEFDESFKVLDVLNLAFKEVFSLENKMHILEKKMNTAKGEGLDKVLKEYSRITQLYETRGGYDIQEKLSKVCAGLKIDEELLNKSFHLLSGGEKTTVVLGKLLIDQPDILLLDEPTNHLDTDSIEWLEGYLNNYHGIVIVVSHDRYFLDSVVNKIIEIEDMTATTFKGNYSEYMRKKEELMRIQLEDFKEQKKKIQAMEKTIKDLRQWALKSDNNKFFKRATSIQIKLSKMQRIKKPIFERPNMRLNLNLKQRSGNETIKAIGVTKHFDDKLILNDANVMIKYGERVALLGPNGSGKTTFLKMLLGKVQVDSGQIKLGANVKVAYLPQNITFDNEEHTVLECFREDVVIAEGKGREYLAKYMFFGKSVFTKVKFLSGGERIRLKLAKLLYEDVNLLILDEPTNHLDIDSIETLEDALEDFKGTIFFISHDRYFINKISQRIIAIENNSFKSYDGNYNQYKETKTEIIDSPKPKTNQKVKLKSGTKEQQTQVIVNKLESKILNLEESIADLDQAMAVCGDDYQTLGNLYNQKNDLNQALESVWAEWESVQELN